MTDKNVFGKIKNMVDSPVPPSKMPIKFTKKLADNIDLIKKLFEDDDCLKIRHFLTPLPFSVECAVVFIESMADDALITEFFIRGIMMKNSPKMQKPMENDEGRKNTDFMSLLFDKRLLGSDVIIEKEPEKIVAAIISGNAVLFAENSENVAIADTKGYQGRTISEPENEKLLRGPREGFTERFMINVSLIRRRLATTDLKVKFFKIGRRSNTSVAICYLDSLTDKKILKTLCDRLAGIDIDGIIDSNHIEEHIRDKPVTPFKTVGSSERPDTVVSRILEGRICIIVDGSPVVLTAPFIFIENFQSGDDYYQNYFFASIGRILRFLGFFLTLSTPAVYVSLLCFHQQMMPTNFALSIMSVRTGVPFPIFVECFLLLIVFEILREASLRMPAGIAQTFGIVGAIVVGESVVSANIIDAPMVIVIGFTALTELMLPRLKGVIIFYRALLLILAGIIGLYGYIFGVCLILVRLLSIESFGVLYISYLISGKPQQMKDTIIRAPIPNMIERPEGISTDMIRQTRRGDK